MKISLPLQAFLLTATALATLTSCKTPVESWAVGTKTQTTIQLELIGRHTAGVYGEGAAEVLAFHESSKTLWTVNGAANRLDIVNIRAIPKQSLTLPFTGSNLSSHALKLPTKVQTADGDLLLKSPNSIAIHDDLLAVAMQNKNKQGKGAVLFYGIASEPQLLKAVQVGALPDMLTFSPDGTKVVVANEGEPSKDYRHDPEGSVSLINLDNQTAIADHAIELNFHAFNDKRAQLSAQGVKFASPEGTSVAQDLEPEYVSVSEDNRWAYVTLQENNGIAIVDLSQPQMVDIKGLGYKNWNHYALDVSNKDGVQINQYENLFGLYQPDSIASYQVKGKTYLVTANEGDAREYIYQANEADCQKAGHKFDEEDGCISYSEEVRAKKLSFKSPSVIDSYYNKNGIGRLKVTKVLGDKDHDGYHEELYAYGARSFSIWDEQGKQVFDSGDQFAKLLLAKDPVNFNTNENANQPDSRSDDKGAEPEALTLGEIDGKTYAFIGLERQGCVLIYDISNPQAPFFVNQIENRNFNVSFKIDDDTDPVTLEGDYQNAGDLAPEGLQFISANQSPTGKPLLAVANEVSGSVSIYQIRSTF
ncbi:choice-of-anchor I family protein [Kangiella sp. TOML190]|uniref:choice-of-anchor I family protein n=1 Tax=Kangiella sp. TOML190 TaxID=2931351 RepID=UPI00203D302C|nr:choice-of-anchor I family protein [Kangiella sp. TOML190]